MGEDIHELCAGEDILHGPRDDVRLLVVSRLERGKKSVPSHTAMGELEDELTFVSPEAVCSYANTTEL